MKPTTLITESLVQKHLPIHWIMEEIPPNIKWQCQTDPFSQSIYDIIGEEYNHKMILFV